MKYICPLIVVEDIEKSRYFYETVLNQKVKFDFGENVTFEGDFAIHLEPHFSELIDKREIKKGGNDFELYFENDKIEDIVATLKDNNVDFVHELRQQPWKQRVVRFYDPDKHIIEVGESMEYVSYRLHKEGMEIEAVAEITCMPVEFVEHSIKTLKGLI